MTDNFDEFDQDQFDETEIDEGLGTTDKKKHSLSDVLNKPVVKLLIIVGVVGVAIAGALGAFSGSAEIKSARMVNPPTMHEIPGGDVTPFFAEQNDMANKQRVQQAIANQGSAMPTPIGNSVEGMSIDELSRKNALEEFTAQTERLKREWRVEQKRNEQKMQLLQQQVQQRVQQGSADDSLGKAMQKQMGKLMGSWVPKGIKVITGTEPVATTEQSQTMQTGRDINAAVVMTDNMPPEPKTLVPAGTVNYAQLLIEANSDVPGPIMVQILSGPLRGGRAIGQFKVMYEELVLSFTLAVHNGQEYPINAIALNPETTLGAMATDVDHRYFKRIILPAAAGFMSSFGSALTSAGSQTTVAGDSVVINELQKGYKEAAFEGMAKAGDTVAKFFEDEASRTKTLVRVQAGAPMGLFFLQSVTDQKASISAASTATAMPSAITKSYRDQGYGMPNISTYPTAGSAGNTRKGIKTPGGTTVIY